MKRAVAALALTLLQQLACLPLDDLSSYSSAWERQPAVSGDDARDGSVDSVEPGDGGAAARGGDAGLDASSPLEPTTDAGDGAPAPDAGERPSVSDAGPALDAGEPDAAP